MRIRPVLTVAALAIASAFWAAPAQAGDYSVEIAFGRHGHGHGAVRVGHGCAPPVVVRTVRPRVVHVRQVWIEGRYEVREVQEWVPGRWEVEVKPARYEKQWDPITRCHVEVQVRPERRIRTWIPGYHVTKQIRTWVPGRWESCSDMR